MQAIEGPINVQAIIMPKTPASPFLAVEKVGPTAQKPQGDISNFSSILLLTFPSSIEKLADLGDTDYEKHREVRCREESCKQ